MWECTTKKSLIGQKFTSLSSDSMYSRVVSIIGLIPTSKDLQGKPHITLTNHWPSL